MALAVTAFTGSLDEAVDMARRDSTDRNPDPHCFGSGLLECWIKGVGLAALNAVATFALNDIPVDDNWLMLNNVHLYLVAKVASVCLTHKPAIVLH